MNRITIFIIVYLTGYIAGAISLYVFSKLYIMRHKRKFKKFQKNIIEVEEE